LGPATTGEDGGAVSGLWEGMGGAEPGFPVIRLINKPMMYEMAKSTRRATRARVYAIHPTALYNASSTPTE